METSFIFAIAIAICIFGSGLCLECYTCERQDNNKDKCVKTTIQCRESDGACYNQVKWGIPPYWTPHGERIHFLNKGCIDFNRCQEWQREQRHTCRRDWYLDWECIECCSGDLCNYYATMGAPRSQQISSVVLLVGLLSSTVVYSLFNSS